MPQFDYQGVDRAGKKVSGKLSVASEGQLRMVLRGQGVRPTKISTVNAMQRDLFDIFKPKVPSLNHMQVVLFTRQLQVLISSSVPLIQALDILAEQAIDGQSRALISALKDKVEGGSYLWEALIMHPKTFPKLYVSLIRAGESSGSTDIMLKRLSRYLEDTERLKKMMKSASIYPIAVGGVGLGVVVLMLTVVIPKFETLLSNQGQKLPWITQILVDASHFVTNNIVIILVGAFAAIYSFVKYIQSDEGRSFFQRLLFTAPIAGQLIQKAAMARFSRTMQTLLSSGVNLLDAVEICRTTVDNAVLEEAMTKIKSEVENGKTLGAVLGRLPAFPRMAVQMITVGESTGNVDKMLDKIADFYEEDVEAAVGGLSKLIEPVMIVTLGGLVGFILIAMYMPVFEQAGGIN